MRSKKEVHDKTDARNVLKDLQEKQFICSQYAIETESGYVITTKSKRPYCKPKKQTNADRIRAMSDEDLAMNMMCPNENGLGEIDCDKSDNCNCYECILHWLQSEVE